MVDTLEDLVCPACGEGMTKVYMHDTGVNVDICLDGCGGIFFDNRELEKVDEARENAFEILDAIKGKTFKSVSQSVQRICSVCKTPMLKMGAKTGGVEIDVCPVCGAKFLDNGELQQIRGSEETGIDKQISGLLELFFAQELKEVTLGLAPEKTSSRRQAVEDFFRKII